MSQRTFPIFFSVSSADIDFAESIWQSMPDDWVYLYSKTGAESEHMWNEISADMLPAAKIFVVFWSRNFISASGCIREIEQAEALLRNGSLRPLVLRLDDCPLSWSSEFSDETKGIFSALQAALDYRTSHVNIEIARAASLVARVADTLLESSHPKLPRPELLRSLRASLQLHTDKFRFFPVAWVSGFNGVGRETIVREYNRNFTPNGNGVLIEINEATLPKQLLLRIESEGLITSKRQLETIQDSVSEGDITSITTAISRIIDRGDYIILRHSRIVEERVDLPEWLDDVVNSLEPATRSKLFIISQVPLAAERRVRCRTKMESQRIPAIDEPALKEFCYQLIGHFDQHPDRWTEEVIDQVTSAARGTIGLLVSLVRAASRMADFDQLDTLIAAENGQMVDQLTVFSRWAFTQLEAYPDEQRTLIFLNDVSPCDIADLEKIVAPTRSMIRVIGKLLELGLVERETDSVYRLTPLLANRLGRELIRPDLLHWQQSALTSFIESEAKFETPDHEFLRIESRIHAALISGKDELPSDIGRFVSAAHWFQAGIRLYHANRHEAAYRLLLKAFNHRQEFAQSTREEIIRYYCLSATRWKKYSEAEQCITLLENDHRTRKLSAFLRANLFESKSDFLKAVHWYEKALDLNKSRQTRLEQTYRPLISCILRTPKPDFKKAEKYAKAYVDLRHTIFSLVARARVYLHWKYRGDRSTQDGIDQYYEDALSALAIHPGVGSAHFELRAEEAEFDKDFPAALKYMDEAVAIDSRPSLRIARWKLMAKYGGKNIAERAVKEMESVKANGEFAENWGIHLPALTEAYASALRTSNQPMGKLNQFAAGMSDAEIASIIRKVRFKRS